MMMKAPARLRPSLAAAALVAIDLDGTLLDPSGSVPLDTRRALQRARKHVLCCVATGRNRGAVASLGLDVADGVFANGALAFLGGEKIYERIVERAVCRTVEGLVKSAQDTGVCLDMISNYGDRVCAPTHAQSLTPFVATLMKVFSPVDLASGPLESCHAIHILGARDDLSKVRPQIEEALKADAHVTLSADFCLSVSHPEASKAAGVAALAEALRLSMTQVVAIGDNENDLSMIEMAGVGVAMGNACPALKRKGDWTVSSNGDVIPGVCIALEAVVTEHARL